jgi:hypothetical protein
LKDREVDVEVEDEEKRRLKTVVAKVSVDNELLREKSPVWRTAALWRSLGLYSHSLPAERKAASRVWHAALAEVISKDRLRKTVQNLEQPRKLAVNDRTHEPETGGPVSDPSPTLNTVRTKPRTLGPASSSSRQLREPPHSFVTLSSPLLVGGGRTLGIKRCRTQS